MGIKVKVTTLDAGAAGDVELNEDIFGVEPRKDVIYRVVQWQENKRHKGQHKTLTRREIDRTTKKMYKQKGTGQARHSSNRSPIWRHGGITFGPRAERDYSEKINKKMRMGALLAVLSKKAKDGEIIFVDSFDFKAPKTKEALGSLIALSKATKMKLVSEKGHSALVALATAYANALLAVAARAGELGADGELCNLVPISGAIFAGGFRRERFFATAHLDPSYTLVALVVAVAYVRAQGASVPPLTLCYFATDVARRAIEVRDSMYATLVSA